MKFINSLMAFVFIVSICNTEAQTINWKNIGTEKRHFLNVNFGLEYGLIYGIGYGFHIDSKLPVIFNIEYSFPSGNKLTDDFKTKFGGKVRLYEVSNFQFSASIQGVFRRYENDFVRLVNFGSDLSGIVGYYKPKWFVSGELGFDKATVTNFKHSQIFKENYPQVVDGWYETSTGGNFYYGLQTGISSKNYDVYLKGGSLITQDLKTKPTIPFYGQLGFNIKL